MVIQLKVSHGIQNAAISSEWQNRGDPVPQPPQQFPLPIFFLVCPLFICFHHLSLWMCRTVS